MQQFRKYRNKKLDGRYKIFPHQYPRVRFLYKKIGSSRKVATIFGVTKNIILLICNPDYKKRDRQRKIKNKAWLRYYNRKEHTRAIARYRSKKKLLNHVVIKSRT